MVNGKITEHATPHIN